MTFNMSTTSYLNIGTSSSTDATPISVPLENQIVFYIFLLLEIPSVSCSLLLFYYFARISEVHQQYPANQTIIYLLLSTFLVNVIDIPIILSYLQNFFFIELLKNPISFCMFWYIYDCGMYALNLWLMALFAFEHYLSIFFKQVIMRNSNRRFIMYYLSAAIITLFVFGWFTYFVVFYPCEQIYFDFTMMDCNLPCFLMDGSLALQNGNMILLDLLPSFLTVLFTSILISHVIYQKRKINKHLMRQDTWKRTRKMFLQLLPVTFAFLLCNLPLIIVVLLAVVNPWFFTTPYFYANNLTYCWSLLMPFAILSKQSAMKKRLFNLLRLTRFNRTVPITTGRERMQLRNNQTTQRTAGKVATAAIITETGV